MNTKATIDLSGCTGLTAIPTNAFYTCTDVTLPNTVTSVASGGLKDCNHVYVAPKDGYSLAVNGTPVAVGGNGETTAIGTLDTRTGQFSFDNEAWYTLDGRRLDKQPTAKGLYIYGGKKQIIH